MSDNIIITNLAPVPDKLSLYADETGYRPLSPIWRRFFNDMRDRVGAASGSIIYDASNNSTALVTLSGVAALSTNLGTFTGTLIPNSSTIKAALQALETPLDSALVDIADLVTLSGVGANSTDLGTFTGTIISDNSTIKTALQELESYSATTSGTVTSVAALTLGTTGTDLSSSVATATSTPVITLNVPSASSVNRGALLAADWTTFNNKQTALVSGTNIKTVNGSTLLGSGDVGTIDVAHGGTSLTSTPTNGQLLIGNGTNYTLAGLTAGTGISVTNGVGTITIANTGTSFSPTTVANSVSYTEAGTTGFKTSLCDATGGAIVVTLPLVASATGLIYTVKKIDSSANTVTLDGNGVETIDGVTTQVISAQYDSLTITSDGSTWWII